VQPRKRTTAGSTTIYFLRAIKCINFRNRNEIVCFQWWKILMGLDMSLKRLMWRKLRGLKETEDRLTVFLIRLNYNRFVLKESESFSLIILYNYSFSTVNRNTLEHRSPAFRNLMRLLRSRMLIIPSSGWAMKINRASKLVSWPTISENQLT